MKQFWYLLSLLLLLWSCSNPKNEISNNEIPEHLRNLDHLTAYPLTDNPPKTIQLTKEQTFGPIYPPSGIPPPMFGNGPYTAVDKEGRVFMADRYRKVINVYNPDGSPAMEIGRDGKGPGEFGTISSIFISDNRLVAYDGNLIRAQVFSPKTGEVLDIFNIDSKGWNKFEEVRLGRPLKLFPLTDSTYLSEIILEERNDRRFHGYYMLDDHGEVISGKIIDLMRLLRHTFQSPNGGVGGITLPFTNKGIVDVSPNGTIYHANTREFLVKTYNPEGTYRNATYYPYANHPLTREAALAQFDSALHDHLRDAEFPETWPVLESMLADDENRMWVSTLAEDPGLLRWHALDPSGKLLGTFEWPKNEEIVEVKNGKLYVEVRDDETRDRFVIRYGIKIY